MLLVGLMRLDGRDRIPLFRRGQQAQAAIGGDAIAVQDDLHARILLVEEYGTKSVDDADTARIELAIGGDLHCEARIRAKGR